MIREKWWGKSPAARMLMVVVGIILIFALLIRVFPESIFPLLGCGAMAVGLVYAGWELVLIRKRRTRLEEQLLEQRRDWQRGLPAHLRKIEEMDPAEPTGASEPNTE